MKTPSIARNHSDIQMIHVPELAEIAAEQYAEIAENYRTGCGCAVNCFDVRSAIRNAQASAAHYIKLVDAVIPAFHHLRALDYMESYRINDKYAAIRTGENRWELGEMDGKTVTGWGFHGTAEEVAIRAFRD